MSGPRMCLGCEDQGWRCDLNDATKIECPGEACWSCDMAVGDA